MGLTAGTLRVCGVLWLASWFLLPHAHAEVRLPDVLGDNMVLQRDCPVPIWGWAQPQENIAVIVQNGGRRQQFTTTADATGHWQVRLSPMKAGGPLQLIVRGTNEIILRSVLVGEVWLCSGQSNMEMPVRAGLNAKQEIEAADYPQLRLFSVRKKIPDSPQLQYAGRWNSCKPATVAEYSAAAYFFGRELHRKLRVPIGLIDSSMGTSPVEAWMSRSAVKDDPDYAQFMLRWKDALARYLAAIEAYRRETAQVRNREAAPKPVKPEYPRNEPAGLFRDMIAPIIPYAIKGVIWYQGESNAERPKQYARLFPALIRDWRKQWDQGDFPFLFVQLPNTRTRSDTFRPYTDFSSLGMTPRRRLLLYFGVVSTLLGITGFLVAVWRRATTKLNSKSLTLLAACSVILIICGIAALLMTRSFHHQLEPLTNAWLREVQQQTAKIVPRTAMIVTIDIGDARRTHPLNKQAVGRRLALAALANVYNGRLEYSGPIYQSMKIENDKVRLEFSHLDGGLTSHNKKVLQGFVIAGVDRVFYWAQARIQGDEVVVWSEQVPQPVAVRYAWANHPPADLYNRVGLPATPFRTDSWPMPGEQ